MTKKKELASNPVPRGGRAQPRDLANGEKNSRLGIRRKRKEARVPLSKCCGEKEGGGTLLPKGKAAGKREGEPGIEMDQEENEIL